MVALVRNIRTDAPQAIHRTAIAADGSKGEVEGKSRLAFGPTAGGAIKLDPDDAVTLALAVGEGIESTLSLRLLPEVGATPAWALLDAGHLEACPVLAGIESLFVAVDHDASGRGERAAEAVADRWQDAGSEVRLIMPLREGYDLNDIVQGGRRYAG
ncbi:toprim domain-containing protein [Rhodoplanes sp. SY1]|uniref:toprim domain-containing protein n=1 Tax=Rhodoplanes sp. SY1 TaxID=3166646 RepID=UPI0038B55FF7